MPASHYGIARIGMCGSGIALVLALFGLSSPAAALASAGRDAVHVTTTSACTCKKCHQEWRKAQKDEPDAPPAKAVFPQSHHITPTTLTDWASPSGTFTDTTNGGGKETERYVLTGRLTLLKVEGDGDLHLQLESVHGSQGNFPTFRIWDVSGRYWADQAPDDAVQAIVEVPLRKPWCAIRQEVLGWANASLPQTPFTSDRDLTLSQTPVISVTGRAFYDAEHAPPPHHDSSKNLRSEKAKTATAVWEIHPVMNLVPARP